MIGLIKSATVKSEISNYYKTFTLMTINSKILKMLRKQADKLAKKIVDSYDFEQQIEEVFGEKIIITSILTKKKGKKK